MLVLRLMFFRRSWPHLLFLLLGLCATIIMLFILLLLCVINVFPCLWPLMVPLSLLARILGECLTVHFLPALFVVVV